MNNPFNETLYNPLPILWTGVCNISHYTEITDPITHQTYDELELVTENEPCRMSYKTNPIINTSDELAKQNKQVMLILRPDLEIPPSSIIEVTQNNRTIKYKNSSVPSVYYTHQEVELSIYDETA